MKCIHLSDLHLGKRVNAFSMLDEQEAILEQILRLVDTESPDAVLIAGDIYDKAVPPAEAVGLFDRFLAALAARRMTVCIISGNHDSPERIAFGGRIMCGAGIHLSPVYNGEVTPIPLQDAHGVVNVYLLPFVKPAHVRRFFEEEEIVTYTDAVRVAIAQMNVDTTARNILVTHQFVSGSDRRESEEITVGGTDHVDASVFDAFDYVALGHLHAPQNCGTSRIRYCGTPLKYSFSEAADQKSATVVELGAKGEELTVRTVPLTPLYDMSELRGTFAALADPVFYTAHPARENYLHITLTDEEDVPDAMARLRQIYPHVMTLDYDNTRTRENAVVLGAAEAEKRSAFDLFAEFFEKQNNAPLTDEQRAYMQQLIESIEEGER